MKSKSKVWIGVLFMLTGMFLGLIAGLLLYAPETEEREDFLFGCKIVAWIALGCCLLSALLVPMFIMIF